ncbi:hypothetical protein [Rhizobium gallicum]
MTRINRHFQAFIETFERHSQLISQSETRDIFNHLKAARVLFYSGEDRMAEVGALMARLGFFGIRTRPACHRRQACAVRLTEQFITLRAKASQFC